MSSYLVNLGYTVVELFESLAGRTRSTHRFCLEINRILQPTGSNVISGRFVGQVISDNRAKFGDSRLNLSREIPPEDVWGVI